VTAADLARLTRFAALPASDLVDWLSADEVDMTGEPESFVLLRGGRRLPVLAHANGACRFLDGANRCGVYAARPACCRTFPLELEEPDDGEGRRHLTVLAEASCPGAFDGADGTLDATRRLDARGRELSHHAQLVQDWNRRQRRHRWAKGRLEREDAFLAFALLRAEPRRPGGEP
jgi:Fe-S-cluster containining protein